MKNRHLHVITNSEIEDFRKCRALWGYRNAELLRPIHEPVSLNYGKLYHLGCDAGWTAAWEELSWSTGERLSRAISGALVAMHDAVAEHRTWLEGEAPFEQQEAREAALAELQEQAEVAQWAVAHYFQRRQQDLDLVPLAIEAPFDVPIPNRVGQAGNLRQDGKMDLVLWDREACQVLLHEHKTTQYGVQTYESRLPLLTQPTGYLRALRTMMDRAYGEGWWEGEVFRAGEMGFWSHTTPAVMKLMVAERGTILGATTGTIAFNVSRRAQPHKPKVNKLRMPASAAKLDTPLARLLKEQEADGVNRGEVSVAEIDTLPEVYERALLEQAQVRHQPITDEQRAKLAALQAKSRSFFEQFEFYRGPAELERWRKEMWVEARQIREAEREPSMRTRNPHACTGPGSPPCTFSAVCLAPDDPVARAAFRVAAVKHEELSHGDGGFRIHEREPGRPRLGASTPEPF